VASEFITRRLVLPQMSIVVSNVRGPDVPWYMAGARLVNFAPVSIAFDGLGLNVADSLQRHALDLFRRTATCCRPAFSQIACATRFIRRSDMPPCSRRRNTSPRSSQWLSRRVVVARKAAKQGR
jgi:hypothetical protein